MRSPGRARAQFPAPPPRADASGMPTPIAADGTALHYPDFGSGAPVVLVHAWSLSSSMWEYRAQALLTAGYRCIALDRRGHGRSEVPGGDLATTYHLDTPAGDLAGLIEALDLRDAAIVAHSTGTCEVTRYLVRHGSARVSRVVFLGAMTPTGPERRTGSRCCAPTARSGSTTPRRATSPPAAAGPGCPPPWSRTRSGRSSRCCSRCRSPVQIPGADPCPPTSRGLDVPVMLMHGSADESAPHTITAARRRIWSLGARLIPTTARRTGATSRTRTR